MFSVVELDECFHPEHRLTRHAENRIEYRTMLPQDVYKRRYEGFVKRYEKAKARCEALVSERTRRTERDMELRSFIDELRSNPLVLDSWDEHLWTAFIEKGTVFADGSIEFEFKNGTTIKVESD